MAGEHSVKAGKRLTALDVFLIAGVILLLLAVIGQDIAVYALDRQNRAERFEISFVLRSVEKTGAERLVQARLSAGDMLVTADGKEIGKVNGGLEISSEESEHLCSVSGVMISSGRTVNGGCRLYGIGKDVEEGDRIYVLFEGADAEIEAHGFTLEISSIVPLEQ